LKPSATESKIIFYYGRRSIPRPWAIREEEFLVLADSLRRASLEASLAHHRVRRLRHCHRSRSDREATRIPTRQSALRSTMFGARAVMVMGERASSAYRGIHHLKISQ